MPDEQDLKANTDGLARLLDTLVVPETVEIRDSAGRQYTLPTSLPARRQIKVMRTANEMRKVAVGDAEVAALGALFARADTSSSTGLMGSLGAIVMALADNEAFLTLVGRAFTEAHPDVAAQALLAGGGGHIDVLDVFAVEELVAGLLPFSLRILRRAGGLMTGLAATRAVAETAIN